MKSIVLHGMSAAEAWDIGLFRHTEPVEHVDLATCAETASDLVRFQEILPNLSRPLHIAIPDKGFRRCNPLWVAHFLSRSLPRNSFYRIGDCLYAEAPYLFFCLACTTLPFAQACLLGMELCGRYSTHPSHRLMHRTSPGKDYLERPAPTTVTLLKRYAEALGLGRKSTAIRACKMLANGARSPRESVLHLMMHMPRRQGGYGQTGYEINYRIQLPPELAALLGVDTIQVDFFWPQFLLAAEYDGSDYHTSDSQRSYDNIRRSVLRQLGIQVITIDKWQMADMAVLDGIMQMITQTVGGPEVLQDAESRRKRAELHKQLLDSNICLYR